MVTEKLVTTYYKKGPEASLLLQVTYIEHLLYTLPYKHQ